MNKNLVVLICVLLVAGVVYYFVHDTVTSQPVAEPQQENPYGLPDALVVEGMPVDPVCFNILGGEENTSVTLTQCAETYNYKDVAQEVTEDGYISSVFRYSDDPADAPLALVRYKYLGETDRGYNILVESASGGTGQFSSVYIVGENGAELEILDTIAGGDRCNGGIESASVVEGNLVFNQYVTPFDFLDLADSNPYGLKAYQDLDACAVCCYGVARYNQDGFKGISVTVEGDFLAKDEDAPERGLQNCFDKVLKTRMDIGQAEMPTEVVQSFVQEFHDACTVQ